MLLELALGGELFSLLAKKAPPHVESAVLAGVQLAVAGPLEG